MKKFYVFVIVVAFIYSIKVYWQFAKGRSNDIAQVEYAAPARTGPDKPMKVQFAVAHDSAGLGRHAKTPVPLSAAAETGPIDQETDIPLIADEGSAKAGSSGSAAKEEKASSKGATKEVSPLKKTGSQGQNSLDKIHSDGEGALKKTGTSKERSLEKVAVNTDNLLAGAGTVARKKVSGSIADPVVQTAVKPQRAKRPSAGRITVHAQRDEAFITMDTILLVTLQDQVIAEEQIVLADTVELAVKDSLTDDHVWEIVQKNTDSLAVNDVPPASAMDSVSATLQVMVSDSSDSLGASPDATAAALRKVAKTTSVVANIPLKVVVKKGAHTCRGRGYVRRQYCLPVQSPTDAVTTTMTLVFTQREFDQYNATHGLKAKLPEGPHDAIHKTNLRIFLHHGICPPLHSSEQIPDQTDHETVIQPLEQNIVWNTLTNQWEVTIDVSGAGTLLAGTLLL